jgi:radical SAM protein with 4Fe4S-binding SPASM domain
MCMCLCRVCLCMRGGRPVGGFALAVTKPAVDTTMTQLARSLSPRAEAPLSNEPRLYHFVRQNGAEKSRIHLRVESHGSGTLIINANRVLHLNDSAALMTHLILAGQTDAAVAGEVSKKYRIAPRRAQADVADLRWQLDELTRPDGPCPIHDLELDATMPFSARPSAPYRMDLALTYRCNNNCAHCYNARERSFPELDTVQWKAVLNTLWKLAVPHIVFTGGEPTLRDDLPELIAHAESLGQITGLNTNGRRLADKGFVHSLLEAGLDHVQITIESSNEATHNEVVGGSNAFRQTIEGVRNALASPLFVMTNTTMLRSNVHTISETLDFLADLGVPTIGLNALIYSGRGLTVGTGLKERELPPILELAASKTIAHGQRLVWYSPTQYCEFDPTQHDLGVKGCTAALYSMCVEPNGDVLPCQSFYSSMGNILADPWDKIWGHDLALSLRERRDLPEKCNGCSLVTSCGGGCPLPWSRSGLVLAGVPAK